MWQIAGASIPGSDHTMPGKPLWKNNQDSFYIYQDIQSTISIVSDGCGSGKSSEVGSQIGVRVLGEILRDIQSRGMIPNWERIRIELLSQISVLAGSMGVSLSEIIGDFFLFSLLGVFVTETEVTVFHCGDGFYGVNGAYTSIGPFSNNAPPYLSYGLLGEIVPKFDIINFPASEVHTIVLGTDGTDYIPEFGDKLSEWFRTDAIFSNPDSLRRRLALLNLEKIEGGMLKPGPLKDDTTLILLRRQP
jgi:Protein phosphatase 2C